MGARSEELHAVGQFLTAVEAHPRVLVIEGEAGIGKTTLWQETLHRARERGVRVLSVRADQAQATRSYGALADLLGDVEPEIVDTLPSVQRLAVRRVLDGDGDAGPHTDERVVASAFLSLIDELCETSPVLVAIDDVQWLDSSSGSVIGFSARRLKGRAGILAAERTEYGGGVFLAQTAVHGITRVRVRPLDMPALHRVLTGHLHRTFSRTTMNRIAESSGGNPFYALELARALKGRPATDHSELPGSLADLVRSRLTTLPTASRDVLLAAATVGTATVDLLARVTGHTPAQVIELLEDAEDDGVVVIDGNRVRFTHPLLARGVHGLAGPERRREMHRALAGLVAEPELRARHLALSSTTADAGTLAAIDEAVGAAAGRGAPSAAAELVELAIDLGGDGPERRITAAELHFRAGDTARARHLLDPVLRTLPPGLLRARAANLLATIRTYDDSVSEAVTLLEDALPEAAADPRLLVSCLLQLSFAHFHESDLVRSVQRVQQAAAEIRDLDDPGLTSQVLTMTTLAHLMFGDPVDEELLQRALELEDRDADIPVLLRASVVNVIAQSWLGRLDEAHAGSIEQRRRCLERGAESDMMVVAVHRAMIEIWRGEFAAAAAVADESMVHAELAGTQHLRASALIMRAMVDTYLGRLVEARAEAAEALDAALRCGSATHAAWAMIVQVFTEVTDGEHAAALKILQRYSETFGEQPGGGIMTMLYLPDAIEAMLGMGEVDAARPLIETLETTGRTLDRAFVIAAGARCRAMWLAARNDVPGAIAAVGVALDAHDRVAMPFERARTLLLLGQLQRRQRSTTPAVHTLEEAYREFDRMGTSVWTKRVRAELAGLRQPVTPAGLTPSEHRVALLAADGMSNRDVAKTLSVSLKTVEANLTQVYRKLGIRSRAQINAQIRQQISTDERPTPKV